VMVIMSIVWNIYLPMSMLKTT